MRTAARLEILVVENAVVFVGHLFKYQVLILCGGHHQQVLERVVQIAAVIRMYMCGGAIPAFCSHVGHGP